MDTSENYNPDDCHFKTNWNNSMKQTLFQEMSSEKDYLKKKIRISSRLFPRNSKNDDKQFIIGIRMTAGTPSIEMKEFFIKGYSVTI